MFASCVLSTESWAGQSVWHLFEFLAPLPRNLQHTYSALMNVCIKANELELAQDVYRQMIEEGCVPNLVTYNILIDVYVKKGQWEEAVTILGTLERQVSRHTSSSTHGD